MAEEIKIKRGNLLANSGTENRVSRRVLIMKEEGIKFMSTGKGRMESCRGSNYLLF
jgi:hypothetical protein